MNEFYRVHSFYSYNALFCQELRKINWNTSFWKWIIYRKRMLVLASFVERPWYKSTSLKDICRDKTLLLGCCSDGQSSLKVIHESLLSSKYRNHGIALYQSQQKFVFWACTFGFTKCDTEMLCSLLRSVTQGNLAPLYTKCEL